MTYTLQRLPEVLKIFLVQPLRRVVVLQPIHQVFLQIERDRCGIRFFGNQKFFIDTPAARVQPTGKLSVGNQEIIDVVRYLQRVEIVQQGL